MDILIVRVHLLINIDDFLEFDANFLFPAVGKDGTHDQLIKMPTM